MCVRCPHWPAAAAAWITRSKRRCDSWPSRTLIERVTSEGCHFVAVSHKLSTRSDTEFGFSFSNAENILIDSWTPSQKYYYYILRFVKKCIDKESDGRDTFLCTYYLKTLMLWFCEMESPDFWNTDGSTLTTSVEKLLCFLIEWTIERRFPNYFIPTNNMMDHIPDGVDLNSELNTFLSVYGKLNLNGNRSPSEANYINFMMSFINDRVGTIQLPEYDFLIDCSVIDACEDDERRYIKINVPNWLINAYKLSFWSLFHEGTVDREHLYRTLAFEIGDLCRGLHHQIEAFDAADSATMYADAQLELKKAQYQDSRRSEIFVDVAQMSFDDYLKAFHWCRYGMESYDANYLAESIACEPVSTYEAPLDTYPSGKQYLHGQQVGDLRQEMMPMRTIVEVVSSPFFDRAELVYINVPFKLSLPCSKAYLANFLYTVRRTYPEAIRLCDEICDADLEDWDRVVDSPLFRVLLQPSMVRLYDAEIQTLFGFTMLCGRLLPTTSAGDRVIVSPTSFAEYVKMRCGIEQTRSNDSDGMVCRQLLKMIIEHFITWVSDSVSQSRRNVLTWIQACMN